MYSTTDSDSTVVVWLGSALTSVHNLYSLALGLWPVYTICTVYFVVEKFGTDGQMDGHTAVFIEVAPQLKNVSLKPDVYYDAEIAGKLFGKMVTSLI